MRHRAALAFLWVFFWTLAGRLAPAVGHEGQPPEIMGLEVGFAGHYKPGMWTPVRVKLRGGDSPAWCRVSITVPDGDGVPCISTLPEEPWEVARVLGGPCAGVAPSAGGMTSVLPASWAAVASTGSSPPGFRRIDPGAETSVLLYSRFGRRTSSVAVELHEARGLVGRRVFQAGEAGQQGRFPPALPSAEYLILVAGSDAMGVEEAVRALRREAGEHATVARLEDLGDLPDRWCGYEAVDALVLSTSRPELLAPLRPDSPQARALHDWVSLGGTVVLCVGSRAEQVLEQGSALGALAPGKLQRVLLLRQFGALETYCGSTVPVRRAAGGTPGLRVPQLAQVQGRIEAREGNLPLVIRRTLGFGQIVFVALDLDVPPLSQWPDRGKLMRRLLDIAESPLRDVRRSATVMHFGFDDMAGQLRSALDQFAGIPAVSFWLVVGVFAGYLLWIGPVDYLLLRKLARRMELTWLSFPPVVAAVCVGAWLLAYRLKGDQIRANQVDLVDVDVQSGRLRGTSCANLFSPRTQTYDLAFVPQVPGGLPAAEVEMLVGWFGLPGSGLGGMDPGAAAPVLWTRPYRVAPRLDALEKVPVPVWSTKSLAARWTARIERSLESDLTDQARTPVGQITNRLDFPLAQCLLCYDRWVYELGTLNPGQSARIIATQERRDLRTFLTGQTLFLGVQRQAARYDQSSVDLAYILRAMTFFKRAGGYRYTGLTNRYQGYVDLSDLLSAGRAILVAVAADDPRSPHHGAQLVCDGHPAVTPRDRHTTLCRFVLPVNRPTAGPE
ncbi:MAG: hypothetical protein ACUVUC_09475 [Thermoguttaceae bacterium]